MIEQQDEIKKYLTNKMDETERESFKNKLANNSELKKEVDFNKDLMLFLEDDNPELEAMLTNFGNEFSSKSTISTPVISNIEKPKTTTPNKKWLFWIIGILGILIAVWLISQAVFREKTSSTIPTESNSVLESAVPTEDVIIPNDTEKESNISDTEVIEEKEKPKEEDKITPNIPKTPDFTPKRNIPTRSLGNPEPMASLDEANYTPNRDLEILVIDGIRSNELVFELNEPKVFRTFYKKNKETKIVLDGTMNKDVLLKLVVFDNSNENFMNNRSVLKADFQVKPDGDDFQFSFIANTTIPKGLYYFFVYNKQTEEMLAISKFSVK